MKRLSKKQRVLSTLLSVLMAMHGMPVLPAQANSAEPQGFRGQPLPVDILQGALTLASEDLALGVNVLPLRLWRVYRSDLDRSEPGVFGHRWHSLLDMAIVSVNGSPTLLDEEGRLRTYVQQDNGHWISAAHEFEEVFALENGGWERRLADGFVYRFDADGHLLEITDLNGRFIRLDRVTEAGQTTVQLKDRYGRWIAVALDENGRAVSALDSTGRQCEYGYDEQERLISFINHTGGELRMSYDAEHRMTGVDGGAIAYRIAYRNGRVAEQATNAGVVEQYVYRSGRNGALSCRIRDAVGGVVRLERAADGSIAVTDSAGVTERIWLNERELPVRMESASGSTTLIAYDDRANPISIVEDGAETRLTYSSANTLASVRYPAGDTLTLTYDSRRNITSMTTSRGARNEFEWNALGQLRAYRMPTGESGTITYDANGHVQTHERGDGQRMLTAFDALGQLREATLPSGVKVQYDYDAFGQIERVQNSEGQHVALIRNALGQIVRMEDAAGNEVRMDYDAFGMPILAHDAMGAVTRMSYDAVGRLTSLTDANENTTQWTYDAAGRLMEEIDALGQSASISYDARGLPRVQTNRRGQSIQFEHDPVGRMTGIAMPGSVAALQYDAYGRLAGMQNGQSDYSFVFEPDGLMKSVLDRVTGLETSYEYDQAGRRIAMTVGGETIHYRYDTDGRVAAIEADVGRIEFEYDALGRRVALRYPNGVHTAYRYDRLGRVEEIRTRAADGTDISRFRYEYDILGNRTHMTEGEDRVTEYRYDAANRLTYVAEPDRTVEYIYDGVGNRTAVVVNGERVAYTIGRDNRLISKGDESFEYDKDGNLISRIAADGQRTTYRYDAANRMIETVSTEGRVRYAYAPNDARVARTENDGTPTRFVFDFENVVAEVEEGNPVARYLHGTEIDEPLALMRDGQTAFYHADALGSVRRLTDPSGEVIGQYRFDVFGAPLEAQSKIANPYAFIGREWDPIAGMHFLRARFLDPETGRFSSKDPLGVIPDVNQYAYVWNNPVNLTDPSGRFPPLLGVIAAGMAAKKSIAVVSTVGYLGYNVARNWWQGKSWNEQGWGLAVGAVVAALTGGLVATKALLTQKILWAFGFGSVGKLLEEWVGPNWADLSSWELFKKVMFGGAQNMLSALLANWLSGLGDKISRLGSVFRWLRDGIAGRLRYVFGIGLDWSQWFGEEIISSIVGWIANWGSDSFYDNYIKGPDGNDHDGTDHGGSGAVDVPPGPSPIPHPRRIREPRPPVTLPAFR